MTKADIIDNINHETGVDKVTTTKVVEAFTREIRTAMADGKNVYIRRFGSFALKKRAQKTARNISQGTTMIIPAHTIPAFKPAREFKKQVENNVK